MNKSSYSLGIVVIVLICILIVVSSVYVGLSFRDRVEQDVKAKSDIQWIVYDTRYTEGYTMYMSVKMGDGFMLVPLFVPESYVLYIKPTDPSFPTRNAHVHVSKEEFYSYEVGSIYTGGLDD